MKPEEKAIIEAYVEKIESNTRQDFGVEERIRKLLYEFRGKIISHAKTQNNQILCNKDGEVI